MIYLDTGCLLKLYYPEPESKRVAALVVGKAIVFSGLHELELSNALELKSFRREATPKQIQMTRALVETDVRNGTLYRPTSVWEDIFREAATLANDHTRRIGCRSLDILHCATARHLSTELFVTTDQRQRKLATKIGLNCPSV